MITVFVVLVLSYLAGSIPTAIIASKLVLKDDIRIIARKVVGDFGFAGGELV